eukprot:scaffold38405_cov23-Tisochrysis_lutea.AAC.1
MGSLTDRLGSAWSGRQTREGTQCSRPGYGCQDLGLQVSKLLVLKCLRVRAGSILLYTASSPGACVVASLSYGKRMCVSYNAHVWAHGENKPLYSPYLTESNAERLANALCRMRGAALKLGQMLSIQDENIMPPQVLAALGRALVAADLMLPCWDLH